jgi:uncharacterized protein (UPF0332 family)
LTPEVADLLIQARESLAAAKTLHREGFHGFAAARAYYAMDYGKARSVTPEESALQIDLAEQFLDLAAKHFEPLSH